MSARPQSVEALRRKVARLSAKLRTSETAWMYGGPDAWRAHVATKTCRRALEATARKHGRTLGPTYEALVAQRLVCVDVRDGAQLDDDCAARIVAQWAEAGPRSTARRAA